MKFKKEKSPRSTKSKSNSTRDFLRSTQIVAKKQDSSFQNWEVSRNSENLLCGSIICKTSSQKNMVYLASRYQMELPQIKYIKEFKLKHNKPQKDKFEHTCRSMLLTAWIWVDWSY